MREGDQVVPCDHSSDESLASVCGSSGLINGSQEPLFLSPAVIKTLPHTLWQEPRASQSSPPSMSRSKREAGPPLTHSSPLHQSPAGGQGLFQSVFQSLGPIPTAPATAGGGEQQGGHKAQRRGGKRGQQHKSSSLFPSLGYRALNLTQTHDKIDTPLGADAALSDEETL